MIKTFGKNEKRKEQGGHRAFLGKQVSMHRLKRLTLFQI